jgi:hypothetical protein
VVSSSQAKFYTKGLPTIMDKSFIIIVVLAAFNAPGQTPITESFQEKRDRETQEIIDRLHVPSTNANTIDGAFGLKLGDKVDCTTLKAEMNFHGSWLVSPPKPSLSFQHYWVKITPQTKLIYSITATKESEAESSDSDFLAICEVLRKKYGSEQELYPPTTDGEYCLSHDDRSITVSRNKIPSDVFVEYRDRRLFTLAMKEQNEIRNAQIKADAKKLDDSGL